MEFVNIIALVFFFGVILASALVSLSRIIDNFLSIIPLVGVVGGLLVSIIMSIPNQLSMAEVFSITPLLIYFSTLSFVIVVENLVRGIKGA